MGPASSSVLIATGGGGEIKQQPEKKIPKMRNCTSEGSAGKSRGAGTGAVFTVS